METDTKTDLDTAISLEYQAYLKHQQSIVKFLRTFLSSHCVPSCTLTNCTNWTMPSGWCMVKRIGCIAHIQKKDLHGTIDFNLMSVNTKDDMQFSLNNMQVLRLSWHQCTQLLSLEEGPAFAEALQKLSDQKFMTKFPDPTVSIQLIE